MVQEIRLGTRLLLTGAVLSQYSSLIEDRCDTAEGSRTPLWQKCNPLPEQAPPTIQRSTQQAAVESCRAQPSDSCVWWPQVDGKRMSLTAVMGRSRMGGTGDDIWEFPVLALQPAAWIVPPLPSLPAAPPGVIRGPPPRAAPLGRPGPSSWAPPTVPPRPPLPSPSGLGSSAGREEAGWGWQWPRAAPTSGRLRAT